MIRDVDLINYLPPYIQEYREIQHIMNAENPEIQLVEDDSEIIKNNMFVLHTNELGIKRYEDMFGLIPSKDYTLYNRQMNVLAQYTNSVIYTLRGLIERMNIICGVGNYQIILNANKYELKVILYTYTTKLLDTINTMLKDMIPANISWSCSTYANNHKALSIYPQYIFMQFTHQELIDEVIEHCISATCDNISNHAAESFELVYCEHMSRFGMRKV